MRRYNKKLITEAMKIEESRATHNLQVPSSWHYNYLVLSILLVFFPVIVGYIILEYHWYFLSVITISQYLLDFKVVEIYIDQK